MQYHRYYIKVRKNYEKIIIHVANLGLYVIISRANTRFAPTIAPNPLLPAGGMMECRGEPCGGFLNRHLDVYPAGMIKISGRVSRLNGLFHRPYCNAPY